MSSAWRWVVATLGPLALGGLVWWAWFAVPIPPAGDNRLVVALAVAGATAVSVGAFLAWWAGRDRRNPDNGDPAAPQAPPPVAPSAQVGVAIDSTVIGTNPGTVFNAKTIYYGTVPPHDQPQGESESDRIESTISTASPRVAQNNLPLRNPAFTGRRAGLRRLSSTLTRGPVAVVAVRGLGGVGKSQLALEYAHRTLAAGNHSIVWWVRADSPAGLVEDLAELAQALEIKAKAPPGELATMAVAKLRELSDWLVVFDNAEEPNTIHQFLPSGGGQVLITSRYRGWGALAVQVDVETFERAESIAFLKSRTGHNEPNAAGHLAQELGDLPLALAQAAAYIDKHGISIEIFLAVYRDHAAGKKLRAAGLDNIEYPNSVSGTWLLHFRDLESEYPAALDLLRLCAFLDPDEIDLSLIAADPMQLPPRLAAAWEDPLARLEVIGALADRSLTTVLGEQRIKIHRLVQDITRDQLNADQASVWAGGVLDLLIAAFPLKPREYENWARCFALAAHVQAALEHAAAYNQLRAVSAVLLDRLGSFLDATAHHEEVRIAP